MTEISRNTIYLYSTVHYKDDSFRIFIDKGEMLPESNYHSMQHVHEEIELMCVTDGSITYNINGKEIKVSKGQTIFVNSNRMHVSYLKKSKNSSFYVLVVHPFVYSSNPTLYNRYCKFILENDDIDYLILDNPVFETIFKRMKQAEDAKEEGYQLSLVADSYHVLSLLYEKAEKNYSTKIEENENTYLLNKMTSYIYNHYGEKITLKDIADCGHVSTSKCSRIFNQYMNHSPIDFLNLYRLEVSSDLLRNTKESINNISMICGFDQQSYFTRMFKKEYGCTPGEYRKNPCDKFVH